MGTREIPHGYKKLEQINIEIEFPRNSGIFLIVNIQCLAREDPK